MTRPSEARRVGNALLHTWRMTNRWSPMVRDARGRPVPVFRIDKAALEQPGGLTVEQFHRVREYLAARSPRGVDGKPAACYASAIACTLLGVYAIDRAGMVTEALALFGIAAVALVLGLTHRHRLPEFNRETAVEAMLRERLCASCAYDLAALIPDPDGCRVCPECGAAWKFLSPWVPPRSAWGAGSTEGPSRHLPPPSSPRSGDGE